MYWESFEVIARAIRAHGGLLAAIPGFVQAFPGFDYTDPRRPRPAIVVAVEPDRHEEAAARRAAIEPSLGGPGLTIRPASALERIATAEPPPLEPVPSELERFLANEAEPGALEFRPPLVGRYELPDDLRLDPVDAEIDVTLCASPEEGFGVLREFLEGVEEKLTVAMYFFTAKHIFESLKDRMLDQGARLRLVLHPGRPPASSSEDTSQEKILSTLEAELGNRFEHARTSVGKAGQFATSYHIKVAVADSKRLWLSSGSWQRSNQARFALGKDPFTKAVLRNNNREYHVVIDHAPLARTFEEYIDHDYTVATEEVPFGPPVAAPARPDLFVPVEEEPPAFAPLRAFKRKKLEKRRVKVQPLLTPDNYAKHVLTLVEGAKKRLWFQNQYISLNGDGFLPPFRALVDALKKKLADPDVDARVILRKPMDPGKIELLTAHGFDVSRFRFQTRCHNKTIIVDSQRVLVGSHNWSNEGTVANRDASLLFDDAHIATYFGEIFEQDWNHLAEPFAGEADFVAAPLIATAGAPTPEGMARVSWDDVFGD